MFTVLIAEKEHIDAIKKKNSLFFEPFLESKTLAFCYWNTKGQTLEESVPDLLDVVGRKNDWRAVIINNSSEEIAKTRNPFDSVDHSVIDSLKEPDRQPMENETFEHWKSSWENYYSNLSKEKEITFRNAIEKPLQKLSTWLCFNADNVIVGNGVDNQDAHDWAMDKLGRDEMNPGFTLELLERNQYKKELSIKYEIRRSFMGNNHLNVSYPSEVYCISSRTDESNHFDPDVYWNTHQDSQYSAFTDYNMYFDRMRFLVFDISPPTHRNYRSEYIRFLATVLIFSSNRVPVGALQARRLYKLETDSDDTPLCTLATSYDRKLANTYEVIGNEMEKIRSEIPRQLTDKEAEGEFCTPLEIQVLLGDIYDSERLYASKDYGLFFDTPEDEFHKWSSDYYQSKKIMADIVRQQARSIRKSASQMHFASIVSEENISRLTQYQIDEIKDYANDEEDRMVASMPPNPLDMTIVSERLDKGSEEIRKIVNHRMTKKTAILLAIICLGLFLLCFFPFLFSNNGTKDTVIAAIVLCVASTAILALVLLVSLIIMRMNLVNAIKNYNNLVHELIADLQASLKMFSSYLSASCNTIRSHTVLNCSRSNIDSYMKGLIIRKKHQDDIRQIRALLEENYRDYLLNGDYVDDTMARPYEYDFDQKVKYSYPAPFLAGDSRRIEFISNGNMVTVPSSFITRIIVRMEELYVK